jgi:hypothetical protein
MPGVRVNREDGFAGEIRRLNGRATPRLIVWKPEA